MKISDIDQRLQLAIADIGKIQRQLDEREFQSVFRELKTLASEIESLRETAEHEYQKGGGLEA